MTQSSESAAAPNPSPFDVDSVYLQTTLRHEPMELALDDSVSFRTLALMLLRAYIIWFIVQFVFGIFGIVDWKNGGSPSLLIFSIVLSTVVFWVVLLRARVTEPIGEWRVLLADRADRARSYYQVIVAVLDRRRLPIKPTLKSVKATSNGQIKHTIVLAENEYQTYVTVFPYGTSLYVGWQMWRRRSGSQLIKRALTDRATAANLVKAMLRTDRARAVREAVHLACREAVYAPVSPELLLEANKVAVDLISEAQLLAPAPPTPAPPQLPAPASGFVPPQSPSPGQAAPAATFAAPEYQTQPLNHVPPSDYVAPPETPAAGATAE